MKKKEDHDTELLDKLLEAAKSGDASAVGHLLENHRNYLLFIANRELDSRIKGKVGASDIVQESLLTAHQKFEQFRGDTQPELLAWLRQILIHDLLQTRRTYRGTKKRRVDLEQPLDSSSKFQNPLVDPNLTPRSTALAAEESEILNAAMGELSDDYQRVIRLHNWEHRNFEEIADLMNRTPDATRKLWTRAILKLQKTLAKKGDSE